MKHSIEKLRVEYGNRALLEEDLHKDPFVQFNRWFSEALKAKVFEPNGMVLATSALSGRPSSRIVLLKGIEKGAFVFYTDYRSRKAQQLLTSPFASLTFWWREIYRQISMEGSIQKLPRQKSREYFEKRPRGAQIAAHASIQSAPLASRIELEETYLQLQKHFRGQKIPCPETWGGYRLIPDRMEFWQGHADRLHDRFLYVLVDKEWLFSRLAP